MIHGHREDDAPVEGREIARREPASDRVTVQGGTTDVAQPRSCGLERRTHGRQNESPLMNSPPLLPTPPAAAPSELYVDHVLPEAVIGHFRNVFLWVWRGPATTSTCERLHRAVTDVARAHPQGSGGLTLILPGVTVPSDDVRKRIVNLRREASAHGMRGGAIVHEGDPLRRSIVRGVVTGLGLLARDIYPQAVFGRAEDAFVWLGERIGRTMPMHSDLDRALVTLRTRAETEPPRSAR